MSKRSVNARDEHGKWDIGAGGIELGQTVEETLEKEIKELADGLAAIKDEQEYIVIREQRHRDSKYFYVYPYFFELFIIFFFSFNSR